MDRYSQIHIPKSKAMLKRRLRALQLHPDLKGLSGPEIAAMAIEYFIRRYENV